MSTSFCSVNQGYIAPTVSFTYDKDGNRKYATDSERKRFIRAARAHPSATVRTFCLTLVFTGARLSEVLELTPRRIDSEAGVVVIRCLKKHKKKQKEGEPPPPPPPPVYRVVPLPKTLLQELYAVHAVTAAQEDPERIDERLWPWCRATGWKRVKEVMKAARIAGIQGSPKGLRHGFAVGALVSGVPETNIMRWLGHSRLETTMIYTNAVGAEAQIIARRMWKSLLGSDLKA